MSAAPVQKAKKAAKPKKAPSHPTYSDMIKAAIKNLKERGGSSRQAIVKYVAANYKVDAAKVGQHLKVALRAGVKKGALIQSKGTGASGSFKLSEAQKKPAKAKKPAAKKPKAKKPAGEKKPKAKKAKAPKKKAAAKPKKSPAKKAAKPKKAKSPAKKPAKKTKSPKKAKAAKK